MALLLPAPQCPAMRQAARSTACRSAAALRPAATRRQAQLQRLVAHAQVSRAGGLDDPIELVDGAVTSGPSLAVNSDGMSMPNPFVIGSGPPGTNYKVMKKAFDEGWGGVICKTVSLDAGKVKNVTPRYARLLSGDGQVIGWENIELISDRPFETMLDDMRRLKEEYPNRVLIASVMEEVNRDAWQEIITRCEAVGVDAFEVNFSCPHGMPERRMGLAQGQDPALVGEVMGWIKEVSTKPVWAKMTPNITDIALPARAALDAGADGISAINTIQSIMGINLETLRPEPCVEGYSTPGGYSSVAVKPIALAKCMKVASVIRDEFDGARTLSGLGGVERGSDAAEFILLGSTTVQVCTGVMLHGYSVVQNLCGGLQEFMKKHDFESLDEFRGASLPYFTTHADLVVRQQKALAAKRAERKGLAGDADWTGDGFVKETESMVSN